MEKENKTVDQKDVAHQEDEILFHTRIFDVVKRYQKGHSGRMLERYVVRNPGAVAILPILPDGRILLLKQYRSPTKKYIYEIPAGTREQGEEPILTASRELIEETGYHAGKIVPMTSFYSSPGIFQERLYLFKATELVPGPNALEDGEDITLYPVSPEDVKRMIRSGEIEDAKTLLALLSLFTTEDLFAVD
ncbi:MAG: NUDIX hydrolase [Planctomycetia bacterium]|nr:NUDIX hydrolase [Planctomycetia bacterium]